jgi:3-oxoacyl-(acyl-carrier-protein) synthase
VRRDVVITGTGVISPLGDTPAAVHAALAGDGGPPPAEFGVTGFAAEAYLGERNLRPLDRPARLLTCAALLALRDAGWTAERLAAEDVGLVVGTMFSTVRTIAEFDRRAVRDGPSYASPMDFANTVINAPAGQAAIWHGLRGVNATVAAGAASGLLAVAHAADLVRSGRATAVLAGGVEELSFESACGFRRAGLLCDGDRPRPFDARRSGFALGEGAAVLVLEDAEAARRRGAQVLARVAGHGARFDPGQGCDDESAVAAAVGAMRLALRDAGLLPAAVDCVSAAARGDGPGDRREARALADVFAGRGDDLAVTAVKGRAGEALGATGAVQVVALLEAMRTGTVPGVAGLERAEEPFLRGKVGSQARALEIGNGLVNAAGFDGHCCSVVFAAC